MDQPGGLLLDRFDHFRMAMTGGDDRNSGGAVEEAIAVDVLKHGSLAPRGHQRIAARVRRRHDGVVPLDNRARIRTRQSCNQMGKVRADGFHGFHNDSFVLSAEGRACVRARLVRTEQGWSGRGRPSHVSIIAGRCVKMKSRC